jgi:hypothetical protein
MILSFKRCAIPLHLYYSTFADFVNQPAAPSGFIHWCPDDGLPSWSRTRQADKLIPLRELPAGIKLLIAARLAAVKLVPALDAAYMRAPLLANRAVQALLWLRGSVLVGIAALFVHSPPPIWSLSSGGIPAGRTVPALICAALAFASDSRAALSRHS